MNILLLNCYSRNALAVADNVSAAYNIVGGAVKKSRYLIKPDKFFVSKRLSQVVRYTDPGSNEQVFIDDIVNICNQHDIGLIIPTGTSMTNTLSKLKPDIEAKTKAIAAVDDYKKLEKATDKWLCYLLALKAGVPAPKTYLIDKCTSAQDLEENIGFPLIIKPRLSYASKGVQFINNTDELQNALKQCVDEECIAQTCIQGQLHDVTSCSNDGHAFAALSQQRVVTLYDFGGGGIVNLTTFEPEILAYAKKIITELTWNGVLEFDFIKDAQGRYFLLECNPKFWGTTQLTISAGLNVAQYAVDVFTQKEVPDETLTYQQGILYRWIFPECIFHWLHKPFNIKNLIRRFHNTFKNYGAHKRMNNIQWRNIPHLLGIVLNSKAS